MHPSFSPSPIETALDLLNPYSLPKQRECNVYHAITVMVLHSGVVMIFTLLTMLYNGGIASYTMKFGHTYKPPTNYNFITQMKPNSCWQDPTISPLVMLKYIILTMVNSFLGQMVEISVKIACLISVKVCRL